MSANVEVDWYQMDMDSQTTKTELKNALIQGGADESLFDRGTYVIRLKSPFGINYPKGHSPVLYIGEGNVIDRLDMHRKWIQKITSLGYAFPIEVFISFPRVRNNDNAYKNFEAHLLNLFYQKYDSLPLKNSIHETKRHDHTYSKLATHGIIGPGSGTNFQWAINPLPSNPFNGVFKKTHSI